MRRTPIVAPPRTRLNHFQQSNETRNGRRLSSGTWRVPTCVFRAVPPPPPSCARENVSVLESVNASASPRERDAKRLSSHIVCALETLPSLAARRSAARAAAPSRAAASESSARVRAWSNLPSRPPRCRSRGDAGGARAHERATAATSSASANARISSNTKLELSNWWPVSFEPSLSVLCPFGFLGKETVCIIFPPELCCEQHAVSRRDARAWSTAERFADSAALR